MHGLFTLVVPIIILSFLTKLYNRAAQDSLFLMEILEQYVHYSNKPLSHHDLCFIFFSTCGDLALGRNEP